MEESVVDAVAELAQHVHHACPKATVEPGFGLQQRT